MLRLLSLSKVILFLLFFFFPVLGEPAVYFNGGEYVLWVDTAGMEAGKTSYAISVTFRPADVDYSTSTTWGQPVWFLGDPLLLNFTLTKDGYPQLRWYMATGAWDYITGSNVLTDNALYTAVGTWTQNGYTALYINGALVASKTAANYHINHYASRSYNTSLGGYAIKASDIGVDNTAFRGVIYEACAWIDALTPQDALNLSAKVAGTCYDINPTKLSIYFPLEDFPDQTLAEGLYYYNQKNAIQARALYGHGGAVIKSVADDAMTHK